MKNKNYSEKAFNKVETEGMDVVQLNVSYEVYWISWRGLAGYSRFNFYADTKEDAIKVFEALKLVSLVEYER